MKTINLLLSLLLALPLPGRAAPVVAPSASAGPSAPAVGIPLNTPAYEAVMGQVSNPTLRQLMEFRFNNQATDSNGPILEEAIRLRREQAALLGYPTFAHHQLEGRMAKDPAGVWSFLERVQGLVAGPAAREAAQLLALKRKAQPTADRLHPWDLTGMVGGQISYYLNQLKKEAHDKNS